MKYFILLLTFIAIACEVVVGDHRNNDDDDDDRNGRCRLSCGRYETCVVRAYRPRCVCEYGYRRHQGRCYPHCSPNCKSKSRCAVVDGIPQCICREGYVLDKKNKCKKPKCKPKCERGSGMKCRAINGIAQCACDSDYEYVEGRCRRLCRSGYVRDYSNFRCRRGCRPLCGSRERCVFRTNRPRCVCEDGYRRHQGRCFRNYCRSSCQDNSSCDFYRDRFRCQCNRGFTGSKCKPHCPRKCKSKSKCAVVNGIPQCVCREGYRYEKEKCKKNRRH